MEIGKKMGAALTSKPPFPFLTTQALVCFRHSSPVTSPLNFSLSAHHVLWVLGENGSGKSTLLRTIAGLNPAWTGKILWAPHKPSLSYLSHENGILGHLTLFQWLDLENLAGPSCWLKITEWGLKSLTHKPLRFFSAGQKRRASLLKLFLKSHPQDLWLLDEPTHSLDEEGTLLFYHSLKDHCRQGGSAIITTHDKNWKTFWPTGESICLRSLSSGKFL